MVPLSHQLMSGDQVEIITSKKQTPRADWMKFVVTHKARSRIRHWINEQRRRNIEAGLALWKRRLKRTPLQIDDRDLQRYAAQLKFPSPQHMFYEMGTGLFDPAELIRLVKSKQGVSAEEDAPEAASGAAQLQYDSFVGAAQSSGSPALLIDGELQSGVVTGYAGCCNPIPGDEVYGYLSKNGSIKIHRVNCKNSPYLLVNHPDRIMHIEWSRQKDVEFVAALRIVGEDRVGILNDITTVISKNLKTNIRSISVDTEDGVFTGAIVLSVNDLEHLKRLMERLRRVNSIHGVYRFEK
jgi:(p)ppGpp synthase/HD superfamily hydrolase